MVILLGVGLFESSLTAVQRPILEMQQSYRRSASFCSAAFLRRGFDIDVFKDQFRNLPHEMLYWRHIMVKLYTHSHVDYLVFFNCFFLGGGSLQSSLWGKL